MRLDKIAIIVDDYDQAIAFFTGALGFDLVEDSVYVTEGHQGRGLGASLLRAVIAGAAQSGAHVMMASIEATNARSVELHARLGFELVGTAREVGTKFGRWLDLTMMRLPL